MDNFVTLLDDDEGASLVVYGLIASVVAAAGIAAIDLLGGFFTAILVHGTHLARGT